MGEHHPSDSGPCLTLEKLAMKKSLIALAVLAAAGTSFAQSSVTLFGVVDLAYTNTKTGAAKSSSMTDSGAASSRLGFRGVEDLGGGLKADFWLEAGTNPDNGTGDATNINNQPVAAFNATTGANGPVRAGTQGLTFNRRSTMSLMGGFGEVRLGRDYTPQFWNHTVYDPFGTNGVGTNVTSAAYGAAANLTGVRASNSFGYFSPDFSGFKVQLQTYFGETTSPAAKAGDGSAIRATYTAGPLSLAFADSKTKTGQGTDWKATNFGGSYDLGVAKVMAMASTDKITGAADMEGYLVGVTAPLGGGIVKFAMSNIQQGTATDTDKTAIGYVYSLSKRSSVYTTYATTKPKTGDKTTGLDIGMTHSF
jgi:predicted porin